MWGWVLRFLKLKCTYSPLTSVVAFLSDDLIFLFFPIMYKIRGEYGVYIFILWNINRICVYVCFLVLWYRTDFSWAAVWKSLAFHFILTKVQKDEQLDKDNAYTSHFLQSEGQKFSLIFFFPLNLFHVYLSSFNIRYLFFLDILLSNIFRMVAWIAYLYFHWNISISLHEVCGGL